MGKFFDNYQQKFEEEAKQFIFLCGERDRMILVKKYNKDNMADYIRLAFIAVTYGYKRIFLKIAATVEKDMNDFLNGLNILDGNFALLEKWINDFIDNISRQDVQDLARKYWEERKKEIDKVNFKGKVLFQD